MTERSDEQEMEWHAEEMQEGEGGESVVRVRLAREGELYGRIIQMVGGGRFQVLCDDGKERLARIPGKIKRHIWVKENDIVVVKPWTIGGDKRADIVWRYTKIQANWLRNRGYLKGL